MSKMLRCQMSLHLSGYFHHGNLMKTVKDVNLWDGSMIWQGDRVRGSAQQSAKSAKIELVMCPAMLPVRVALS